MYRLGHRQAHHYLLFGVVVLLALAGISGGIIAARAYFQPHTIIKQSAPVTHTVTSSQMATRAVSKGIFTLELPTDWQLTAPPPLRYAIYSWKGTGERDSSRQLDIYIDGVPPDMAFNRLLPVQATGSQLEVAGSISDNCTTFTDKTVQSTRTGSAPSKWGGVNFLCDMANYERNVTAIGSAEGINQVTLHGPNTGTHRVLLVYTDHSATPDYTIFTAIVKSFRLL